MRCATGEFGQYLKIEGGLFKRIDNKSNILDSLIPSGASYYFWVCASIKTTSMNQITILSFKLKLIKLIKTGKLKHFIQA